MKDTTLPNLIICGHGRHGKDTLADLLSDNYGYVAKSSSLAACEIFMTELLNTKHGFDYRSDQECFDDRHNHRKLWYEEICEYNSEDPARMARGIYQTSNIYCGIRNDVEFYAAQKEGLFDLAIWVDASGRGVPEESKESNKITRAMCDITVNNNESELDLHSRLPDINEFLVLLSLLRKKGI